jgi:23S rRNA maturation mini-RNase III
MALITAAQARIEGMKAANAEREANGYALAYDGDAFFEECRRLELLANEVIQQ